MVDQLIQEGQRHDPVGSPVTPYIHGDGGLFNLQGTDNKVISAIVGPMSGLMGALPVVNGEFGTAPNSYGGLDPDATIAITGVTSGAADSFANQPTTDCAEGPVGGLPKAGVYTNQFGRYRFSTREVSMYRAGRLASPCEPLTLQLMNQPNMFSGIGLPSNVPSLENAIYNEIASRIYESVMSGARMFSQRLWIGSPSNNNGEARDIWGLESQINTGTHIDRTSSAVLRALDPDVKLFNYDMIGGSGRDIVEYIEEADNYVTFNAESMGLDEYTYWLVLRPQAFRQATAVWPLRESFMAIRTLTNLGGSHSNINFDAASVTAQRNQMRRERWLPINGKQVPVILDTTIPEKNVKTASQLKAGQYASDIYGIPKTVRGNMPVTFWKYFNHDNGQAAAIAKFAGTNTFTTDAGVFRWYVSFKNGCLTLTWEFSPKLVCLAPQLAFRITNVGYEPLQHERDAYPDSDYFFNGGNTNTPTQKFYTGWSPTTPV